MFTEIQIQKYVVNRLRDEWISIASLPADDRM